jgi:UDP-2,3-diacylglucosamine pyrophosphatase LpxH
MAQATRIFVISDLHLGGTDPAMMSFADELGRFIGGLADRAEGDAIELVLAGDVIDFLAIELDGRTDDFTLDPKRAVDKLTLAIAKDTPVFVALRAHVAAGHGLTILLGNHDIELALPDVQHALRQYLGCDPRAVRFVDDGRAWRHGPVLVEHGNRYDDANLNDWHGLREIASSQSRGETPVSSLEVSFGSQLVHEVVNTYKQTFRFIDTLQPQGILVAYLIAAFEPGLLRRLRALRKLYRAQSLAARNKTGTPPARGAMRSGPDDANDMYGPPQDTSRLDALFGVEERVSRGPLGTLLHESLRPDHHSLRHFIDHPPIPRWRLELVQETLREISWTDDSLEPGADCGPQGAAALRLLRDTDAQVVVMGHTHQARRYPQNTPRAQYINTGTWADLVTVPNEALASSDDGRRLLEQWLKDLLRDNGVRTLVPTWAELRVEADGTLASAELKRGTKIRRAPRA